jgi:hypothetical protein
MTGGVGLGFRRREWKKKQVAGDWNKEEEDGAADC